MSEKHTAGAESRDKAWSCQSGAEDVRRAAQAYADVRIQALHVRAAPEDVRNSHAELLAAIDRLAAPSVMVASKDFEDWWQGWPFSGHKNPQTKGVARRAWDAAQRAAASTPIGEIPAGWVSISDERKPPPRIPVLVAVAWIRHSEDDDGKPYSTTGIDVTEGEYVPPSGDGGGHFESYQGTHHDGSGVTHWMPLPKPPALATKEQSA